MLLRTRFLLAAVTVSAVAACAPASSDPGASSAAAGAGTATERQAAPLQASPSGSAAAEQLQPDTETSQSPAATATVDPDAKVIYLTFDDGPWVPYTQQILDVLADNDATATFFVVGEMVTQHPGLIKKIKAAGHAIGNHTWSHPMLTTLSDSEVRSQLSRTEKVVGGENMGACMRPPYGDTNDRVRAVSKQEGYKTVLWTHWAVDWEQPAIPEFLNYLKAATKDKANILLHDGGGDRPNTVEAVKIMLPKWKKKGFTFQAVPSCTQPLG